MFHKRTDLSELLHITVWQLMDTHVAVVHLQLNPPDLHGISEEELKS